MTERVARRHRTEDAEAEAAVVPGAIMPGAALAADAGIEVDAKCHAALAASNSRYISGTKAVATSEANEIFERVAKTFPVPPRAFEANPEAKEALLKFIAACRARKSRFMLGLCVARILSKLGLEDEVYLTFDVQKAIDAATFGIRTLFDGDSVMFNLGQNRQVQVLVTNAALKNPNDSDSPFYRHRNVARYSAASTVKVVKQFDAQPAALPLLFGDSGSGKTMCGISAVAYMDSTNGPGACLRLRCTSDTFALDIAELLGSDPTQMTVLSKWRTESSRLVLSIDDFEQIYAQCEVDQRSAFHEERNRVAQKLVLGALDYVIEAKNRDAPMSARPLVVFIDEAGQRPAFVRAMCACFSELELAISGCFSRGKCKVKIIMAGTGIECAHHHAGSEPETAWLHHMQPDAWSELFKEVPTGIQQLLISSPDTLVLIINGMLRNARVASIFVDEMRRFGYAFVEQYPMLAMRTTATIAGLTYVRFNPRRGLSTGADFAVVLRAMAQQTRQADVHAGELAKYGLLVDRAEAMAINDTAKTKHHAMLCSLDPPTAPNPKALFLHRDYLGVRYELGIAHIMMLHLALHIHGDRAATAGGFENVAADFIAVALELSRPDVNMDFDFFRTTPPWTGALPMPNGWMAPLMLAERLRRSAPPAIACGNRDGPSQADVDRIISTVRLEPWHEEEEEEDTSASVVKQYLKEHILPTRTRPKEAVLPQLGTVVVNAAFAEYADVIAFVGNDELLLVNAKRYMADELAPTQIFRELYKMGHRDWRSVLAQWRDEGDDNPPSHMVPYLSQKGYERYTKTEAKHANEKQFDSCIEDATDLEKQWLVNSKYGKANNELTDLLREGIKHVTYVIMVYGKPPTALPVAVPHTWPGGVTSDPHNPMAPAIRPPISASLREALKLLLAGKHDPEQVSAIEDARHTVETADPDVLPANVREAMCKCPGQATSEQLSGEQRRFLQTLRHDLSVPDDVLLLFAPSPPHTGGSSTPASKSFAAEQLWGYYPIAVNAPLSPVRLHPILAPQHDFGHHRIV
jgi:hypothetical protein